MLALRLFKFVTGLWIGLVLSGCGRALVKPQEPIQSTDNKALQRLEWLQFRPERVTPQNISKLGLEFAYDFEKSKLATGFGIDKPQLFDAGIYGKVGTKTVFVATSKSIPDNDRLYWAIVRVLSEKYGCFIKNKIANQNTILIGCKDNRSVVIDREISNGYAKFTGRQFDRMGQEIFVKSKAVAYGK